MRILWLKSDLLLPLDKGGRLRTWHLMRHLARRHQITYLSFAETATDSGNLAGMCEVAERVVTIARRERPKGSVRFYFDVAAHLAGPLPYAVGTYRSPAFRAKIEDLLGQHAFHLVVCDFLAPAVNLPPALPCPSVLFTHNVEAEIWRRHAETHRDRITFGLYDTQHRRMLACEASALQRFDGILTVSDADRNTFTRLYPDARVKPMWVIPTGVDTEYFAPDPAATATSEPRLVFTGSMDWLPNEDAMRFFCHDVLPLIRAEEPRARLSIVGRAPTAAVRALADEHIEVTGTVADVRPFMRKAAIHVVPLRIGGGTRLKIFEAMAMGQAVVSTTIGAEGLPLTDGEHALIADGPRAFADAVVSLLRDARRRHALSAAARQLVVDHYDWSAAADILDAALTQCATKSPYVAKAQEPGGGASAASGRLHNAQNDRMSA
jgi:sugar transferase (PEP-CTERM/EpsH1 system associated)